MFDASEVGFGAATYKDANNNIVISYRGTDTAEGTFFQDIKSGWIVGAGEVDGLALTTKTQAYYAEQYFQRMTGGSVFGAPAQSVVLTGHSLGGGLAGYIASLNGIKATVFDHMPFEAAAVVRWIEHQIAGGVSVESLIDWFESETGSGSLRLPDQSGITASSTVGEALDVVRALAPAVAGYNISLHEHP